ncbi:MAG: hypothetical protein IJH40_00625 [Ruminococcus sp.]|uniref:hypothetical protein n=1 Tax=Ruminococcus sp. TaxID=41978 RepID=UPI002873B6E0|nr:hypothetical protein [Ruminococcus sp.]MBQ3284119.1 hypothetical protein [Ruminococcus sp.]
MAKERLDIKKEIESYRYDVGLLQKISCTKEENKKYLQMIKNGENLPDGIHRYTDAGGNEMNDFYTIYKPDLSEKEINEYLTFKKLSMINTIKNCACFFVALTVISIVITIIVMLSK